MTNEELTQELALEGLRLAGSDEAGWYYYLLNENDEVITVWVTEI